MASAYKQKAKSAKKNKECDDLYEAYENLKNAGGDAKAVADLKKKADAAREKTDAGRKAAARANGNSYDAVASRPIPGPPTCFGSTTKS